MTTALTPRAEPVRADSPYQSYVYAYPHKSAYRPFENRPPLADLWRGEDVDALSLYTHIPFCEMRCGFCNLFTRSTPPAEQVTAYLGALERQAEAVAEVLPEGARFARAALGGGTPTYLTAEELTRVYDLTERAFGVDLSRIPVSVETSPATATPDRLRVLDARGATRISMGVQSFLDSEAHAAGRPQKRAEVDRALAAVREHASADLNVDLIYGIERQDARTWAHSLDTALEWAPEEVYLYPLYVRPLTGLGRRAREWDDHRLSLYRQGRDHLLERGYEQVSMRMFRRADAPAAADPDHCCQTDGMVGLGCGARSYTTGAHYSFDYAVGVGGCGRSSPTTWTATGPTSPARRWASTWTRTSGGAATCSSRCCGRRGWTRRPTPSGSAPTPARTSPGSSRPSTSADGWSAGAHRTWSGWPRRDSRTPTRSGRCSSPPG